MSRAATQELLAERPLEALVVAGYTQRARIERAVVGGSFERTIEGASTITLEVHDPAREILRSRMLRERTQVGISGHRFVMAAVGKQDESLTLTFEDERVSRLRRYDSPLKKVRGKVTRVDFARLLAREAGLRFWGPSAATPIPAPYNRIAAVQSGASVQAAKEDRTPGFAADAKLTVKKAAATREQVEVIDRVLAECWRQTTALSTALRRQALIACVACITQEAEAKNDPTPDENGDFGAFQQRADGSYRKPADIEIATQDFLRSPAPLGRPGLIGSAPGKTGDGVLQLHPDKSIGWMISEVQRDYTWGGGSQGKDFAQWVSEATQTVSTWLGSDADSGGGGGSGRYEFTRGMVVDGKRESSWDALQRMADEVQWRCFVVGDLLYFVDDGTLFRGRPRATLREPVEGEQGSPGVDKIDFDFDAGQLAAEATVTCRAHLWDIPPGCVVVLDGLGPADGRWLVHTLSRDLFSPTGEVKLIRPRPALAEPTEGNTQSDSGSEPSSARDEVVRWAKYASEHASKFRYGPARPDTFPDYETASGIESDCSRFVIDTFKMAGADDPSGNGFSGQGTTVQLEAHGKPTSNPRPGDLILYGPKGASGDNAHVQILIGPGKASIGHGDLRVKDYDYRSGFRFVNPFGDGGTS